MGSGKKILNIFTIAVLIFLIVCTFASKYIAEKIQPEAEIINPVIMDLTISDSGIPVKVKYNMVIPYGAFIPTDSENNKGYVYIIKQREGLSGLEYYIKKVDVEILAVSYDNLYAAIDERVLSMGDYIVLSPFSFKEGETVKLKLANKNF